MYKIIAHRTDGQPDWVPVSPFIAEETKFLGNQFLRYGGTFATEEEAAVALTTMPLDAYGNGDLFALAKWSRVQMGTQEAFEEFSHLVDNFDKIYPHR